MLDETGRASPGSVVTNTTRDSDETTLTPAICKGLAALRGKYHGNSQVLFSPFRSSLLPGSDDGGASPLIPFQIGQVCQSPDRDLEDCVSEMSVPLIPVLPSSRRYNSNQQVLPTSRGDNSYQQVLPTSRADNSNHQGTSAFHVRGTGDHRNNMRAPVSVDMMPPHPGGANSNMDSSQSDVETSQSLLPQEGKHRTGKISSRRNSTSNLKADNSGQHTRRELTPSPVDSTAQVAVRLEKLVASLQGASKRQMLVIETTIIQCVKRLQGNIHAKLKNGLVNTKQADMMKRLLKSTQISLSSLMGHFKSQQESISDQSLPPSHQVKMTGSQSVFCSQPLTGSQPFPGSQSILGSQPFLDSQSILGSQPFPGSQSILGSQSVPGSQPFPGSQSILGSQCTGMPVSQSIGTRSKPKQTAVHSGKAKIELMKRQRDLINLCRHQKQLVERLKTATRQPSGKSHLSSGSSASSTKAADHHDELDQPTDGQITDVNDLKISGKRKRTNMAHGVDQTDVEFDHKKRPVGDKIDQTDDEFDKKDHPGGDSCTVSSEELSGKCVTALDNKTASKNVNKSSSTEICPTINVDIKASEGSFVAAEPTLSQDATTIPDTQNRSTQEFIDNKADEKFNDKINDHEPSSLEVNDDESCLSNDIDMEILEKENACIQGEKQGNELGTDSNDSSKRNKGTKWEETQSDESAHIKTVSGKAVTEKDNISEPVQRSEMLWLSMMRQSDNSEKTTRVRDNSVKSNAAEAANKCKNSRETTKYSWEQSNSGHKVPKSQEGKMFGSDPKVLLATKVAGEVTKFSDRSTSKGVDKYECGKKVATDQSSGVKEADNGQDGGKNGVQDSIEFYNKEADITVVVSDDEDDDIQMVEAESLTSPPRDTLPDEIGYDVSPTATSMSSDIFVVKAKELQKRMKRRAMASQVEQQSEETVNIPQSNIPSVAKKIGNANIFGVQPVLFGQNNCTETLDNASSKLNKDVLHNKEKGAFMKPKTRRQYTNRDAIEAVVNQSRGIVTVGDHRKESGNEQRNSVPETQAAVQTGVSNKNLQYSTATSKAAASNKESVTVAKVIPTVFYVPKQPLQFKKSLLTTNPSIGIPNIKATSCTGDPNYLDVLKQGQPILIKNTKKGQKIYPTLKQLIDTGRLQPGQNVLSVTVKGSMKCASLTPQGKIRGARGALYSTPMQWLSNWSGVVEVKKLHAYQQVMYNGRPLMTFCTQGSGADNQLGIGSFGGSTNMTDSSSAITSQQISTCNNPATTTSMPPASIPSPEDSMGRVNSLSQDWPRMPEDERWLNELLSDSTVRLLSARDLIPCHDLPDNFWVEDFAKVKLHKDVWDSVDAW